jgi:hypothetical protein
LEAGFLEGKQFGIQTGFQRFVSIGILQGRLQVWQEKLDMTNPKIQKHVQQMKSFLDDLPISNSDDNVEQVEKMLKRAKAKAKVLSSLAKDMMRLDIHDGALNLKPLDEAIEDVA